MITKEQIMDIVDSEQYRPLKYKEFKVLLNLSNNEMEELQQILNELVEEGKVMLTGKQKYIKPEEMGLVVCKMDMSSRGFGFAVPENKDRDIFISAYDLKGAINKDIVLVKITKKGTEAKRPEGKVVNILKRNRTTFVGTFDKSRNFGFVILDDPKIAGDIFIPKSANNKARDNDKVVVEITKWAEGRNKAEGKILEVIGQKGAKGVDILSIAKTFGIEDKYPDDVIEEIKLVQDKVKESDLKGRKDFRDMNIVTIDGEDAKDLDDAVNVEKLANGNYQLNVHIADVSHYVKLGTALDKEALKRGTSVYLVDKVIPMLPKQLSNGICSLNAGVDRLTLSVVMEIDNNGNVVSSDIYKGVINVRERMTYTNVAKILIDKDAELMERYKDQVEDFKLMEELALILAKKRKKRGSIDFDFPEVVIKVDEEGNPISLDKYELTIANKIIEEFMLICNETVAEKFYWLGVPFMYRVHENPDPEKLETLRIFLQNLGHKLRKLNEVKPKEIQQILAKIKGLPEERVISTIMLRSLKHAEYSEENLGHFGLASEYYCHFTSPIRRYPDLFIHRVISELIKDGYILPENKKNEFASKAVSGAKQSSERERNAEEAERQVEDLMKAKYMKDKVGEDFDGIVSSVTPFGYFVELDNLVEGLVRIGDMTDDYYEFDEKHLTLIGERTRKCYRIGQSVRVKLVNVDVDNGKIDFMETDKAEI